MDFFVEIILELYVGFFEMLIPDYKLKKWQSILLRILSVLITVGILACIAIGIDYLIENRTNTIGVICTIVGCALFAIQTAIYIIVLVHQIKEEKRNKKCRKKSNKSTNDSDEI